MKPLKLCAVAVVTALSLSTAVQAADELSKSDKEFLKNASEMGLTEVELGKLAESKGSAADVKSLGKKLVSDHSKANNELKALARKKNAQLDWDANAAQKHMTSAFEKKSGADFDKEFKEHVAKDHMKAIKLFEDAAKDTKDADIKAFAENQLPALKKHHDLAGGHAAHEKK